MKPNKPTHPLKEVKEKIKSGDYIITDKAAQDAYKWFRWEAADIEAVILKLNDRLHSLDQENNHFKKTAEYRAKPPLMTDYYVARGIYQDENVFLHLAVLGNGTLEITSFKDVDAQ